MKGIILAGGTGSRLHPLTKVTNKHLLPVGNQPMIIHNIKKLVEVDITEIMIITGTEHMGDMISLLGSGTEYNCSFTFRVQDRPDGIGGALALCENFVGTDSCIVILGDNIFEDSLKQHVQDFLKNKRNCQLLLKEVGDPERYGVATFEGDRVTQIEEKPKNPKSNYAITGIYMYDKEVFNIVKKTTPSARGEYEITDINNAYIHKGQMFYKIMKGWWTDAGTLASYQKANRIVTGVLPIMKDDQ